jgi:hypothetical protein
VKLKECWTSDPSLPLLSWLHVKPGLVCFPTFHSEISILIATQTGHYAFWQGLVAVLCRMALLLTSQAQFHLSLLTNQPLPDKTLL